MKEGQGRNHTYLWREGTGNQHTPLLLKRALKDGMDFNRKKLEVVKETGLGKGKACWGKK